MVCMDCVPNCLTCAVPQQHLLLAVQLFAVPHSASNCKAAGINSYLEGQIIFNHLLSVNLMPCKPVVWGVSYLLAAPRKVDCMSTVFCKTTLFCLGTYGLYYN